MAASIRLILAAILASAAVPATVEAAVTQEVGWRSDDPIAAVGDGVWLGSEVRDQLARSVTWCTAPSVTIDAPRVIAIAIAAPWPVRASQRVMPVLPVAPKTSPPAR